MSRPAPAARAVAALVGHELRLTARRGENVLVTLIIPVAVLLFFAGAAIVPGLGGRPVDAILPGSIALAVIATGLVNLGITTAYERSYGVLKRLGSAPLPRWGLLAAKVTAVLALQVVQVTLLIVVARLAFGWGPGSHWSPLLLVGAITLGTLAFSGLGLLLAGTLRAEATLGLANGLFLGFLMLGGIALPVDQLPSFLQPVATALPATALADLLRIALDAPAAAGASPAGSAILLGAWALGAAGIATLRFRWD